MNLCSIRSLFTRGVCCALCCTYALFSPSIALEEDARYEALDLASSKKKEYKLREDFWSGTCKPGEKKLVKTQLFKGNEYWFWLGSDEDNVDISFDLYDAAGKKVTQESTAAIAASGVKVTPTKTGTYLAVFTISLKPDPPGKKSTAEKPAKIWWSIVYGWK
jgi:hypothetical protein